MILVHDTTVLPDQDPASRVAVKASVMPLPEPVGVPDESGFRKQAGRAFDHFTDSVRRATPAWIVNNGTRINFAIKALADSMSIASAVRPGSKSNPRLFANIITLGSLIPGALYTEQPQSQEEIAREKRMSPWEYIVTRIRHAFNPRDHVVEMVGLTTMINGVFTMVSGAKQSSARQMSWELVTGAFTVAAGSALTFMHDRQRAWQAWTGLFLVRTPFKIKQSHQALEHGYEDKGVRAGDKYQALNTGFQLFGNIFSTFYAGVKKLPDGTIVHLGTEDSRKLTYSPKLMAHPSTQISQVASHEMAMASSPKQVEVA